MFVTTSPEDSYPTPRTKFYRSAGSRTGRTLIAARFGAIVCAALLVWAVVVSPMNARLNRWTPATLPADWTARRNRWELGHAIHAALFGAAFAARVIEAVLARKDDAD